MLSSQSRHDPMNVMMHGYIPSTICTKIFLISETVRTQHPIASKTLSAVDDLIFSEMLGVRYHSHVMIPAFFTQSITLACIDPFSCVGKTVKGDVFIVVPVVIRDLLQPLEYF